MSSLRQIRNIFHPSPRGPAKSLQTPPPQHPQDPANNHDSPIFPPPNPQEILANRAEYTRRLSLRQYRIPASAAADTPLFALYRIYEYFVVDYVTGYRNQLEYFWRQADWPVSAIADPKDGDPARYAFLAGTVKLLVRSFNEKVGMGSARDAPAIMSEEQIAYYQTMSEGEKAYEACPAWVDRVPALAKPLVMETSDGVVLQGFDDPRASPEFKALNILIWTPHIHFT